MTFQGIVLDFSPTAIVRLDCELARFSLGLRVKQLQDMRFIKGKRQKGKKGGRRIAAHIVISAKAEIHGLICRMLQQCWESGSGGPWIPAFAGMTKRGGRKRLYRFARRLFPFSPFHETNWNLLKAQNEVQEFQIPIGIVLKM